MNEGDRILMTELIVQLKQALAEKAEAEQQIGVWLERMKLAQDAGKPELFEAARERARRVRDELRAVESRIMDLEVQKESLRGEVKASRTNEGSAVVARTRNLLKSLEGTPMDPTEARFERMEKEADAEDALAALKRRMGQE